MSQKLAKTERYKSKAETWIAGSAPQFKDVADPRGPRNGRNIIKSITLHASLSVTVAGATFQGEDFARIFKSVTIVEKGSTTPRMTEVPGEAMRIVSWGMNGADRTHEHADFAVGGPTTVKFTLNVPFSSRFAYSADDNDLAVELLDFIAVRLADASTVLGASTLTVNSGSYYVIIETYEQMGVVQHVPVEWIVKPFASAGAAGSLEHELTWTKGRLQDLYLYVPGADGGQSLANLDEVLVEGYMPRSFAKDPDLVTFFQRERGESQNLASTMGGAIRSNPFTGSTLRALAILASTGTKSYEGEERTRAMIRLTLTGALPAAPMLIARIVHPRSEAVQQELMGKYKKKGFYVKTEDKTRRETKPWGQHLPYMPIKFF